MAEIGLLKQQLEEMEQAFRQEITELRETHQLELDTISNIIT
jgi:predicted TIM-barrel enzyme